MTANDFIRYPGIERLTLGALSEYVDLSKAADDAPGFLQRLQAGDPSLWGQDPGTPELSDRLGWLNVHHESMAEIDELAEFAGSLVGRFDRVVLCGMGGSGLAAQVEFAVLGGGSGYPVLYLLDSSHPAAVESAVKDVAPHRILFVISSKSGTTLETISLLKRFWADSAGNGSQFIAITDPGTNLAAFSNENNFLRTFLAPNEVGGRYSALSCFGIVPATLAGCDTRSLLEAAARVDVTLQSSDSLAISAAVFGRMLGECAKSGKNKLSLLLGGGLDTFGLWLEQLVAESTGKDGQGVLPVVERAPRNVSDYGQDRFFVSIGLAHKRTKEESEFLDKVIGVGHPVVEIELDSATDLGAQFLWWEIATAATCAVLGVNPFNQPNVSEGKKNTATVLDGRPARVADASRAELEEFVSARSPGEYLAILAFLEPRADTENTLNALAAAGRRLGIAVTVSYGPRYLHSTGQLHKGGPSEGRFVQIVDTPDRDLKVPAETFSFGDLIRAQADGDYMALQERDLPIIRLPSLEPLIDLFLNSS